MIAPETHPTWHCGQCGYAVSRPTVEATMTLADRHSAAHQAQLDYVSYPQRWVTSTLDVAEPSWGDRWPTLALMFCTVVNSVAIILLEVRR